jgi:hypothetical protein
VAGDVHLSLAQTRGIDLDKAVTIELVSTLDDGHPRREVRPCQRLQERVRNVPLRVGRRLTWMLAVGLQSRRDTLGPRPGVLE